ncbi:hypothetical protein, unlikely [Trypanosoma brucei gambiense DAL972]|uniref:Uncharacterized protein n=1 Tax=Trypanosoma brucei gambiense (strain MHOM/CI/86/DAL972) TaxID=679716 RepID=D0A0L5_TRYB9|nr:hypothetical protein, unlikely [Trypanosoma brucei gambiense DAL972]CBH16773.1 hypothetical protein, unlikely [Trypanosoma brucei gambiense DAL972]|eukprot:XP_011779037.1 hypothetical protein, unlikely [Trypanosoma brucei gambiense DAL972]
MLYESTPLKKKKNRGIRKYKDRKLKETQGLGLKHQAERTPDRAPQISDNNDNNNYMEFRNYPSTAARSLNTSVVIIVINVAIGVERAFPTQVRFISFPGKVKKRCQTQQEVALRQPSKQKKRRKTGNNKGSLRVSPSSSHSTQSHR